MKRTFCSTLTIENQIKKQELHISDLASKIKCTKEHKEKTSEEYEAAKKKFEEAQQEVIDQLEAKKKEFDGEMKTLREEKAKHERQRQEIIELFVKINGKLGIQKGVDMVEQKKDIKVLQRFNGNSGVWYQEGNKDSISFKVSKQISITGCGFWNTKDPNGTQLHGPVWLREGTHSDQGKIMAEGEVKCKQDKDYHEGRIHRFQLKEAVMIKQDVFYTFVAKLSGGSSYYGNKGKTTIEENGIKFTFKSTSG